MGLSFHFRHAHFKGNKIWFWWRYVGPLNYVCMFQVVTYLLGKITKTLKNFAIRKMELHVNIALSFALCCISLSRAVIHVVLVVVVY